jgi:hypothetical protein
MMEALRSFETSVLTRATRRFLPEDGILVDTVSPKIFKPILKSELRNGSLISREKIFLVKLTVAQLVKKFSSFL